MFCHCRYLQNHHVTSQVGRPSGPRFITILSPTYAKRQLKYETVTVLNYSQATHRECHFLSPLRVWCAARQSAALINVDSADVRVSSHNRKDRDSFKWYRCLFVWSKACGARTETLIRKKLSLGTQETRAADDSMVLITYLLTCLINYLTYMFTLLIN
jgi:hypothetical protein